MKGRQEGSYRRGERGRKRQVETERNGETARE